MMKSMTGNSTKNESVEPDGTAFDDASAASLFHRTSIRRYTDEPVSDRMLWRVLQAGMQAPSARNDQPWEFYVTRDRQKIEALSKASKYAGPTKNAIVVIVPVYRKEGTREPEMAQINMSIAQENMWLETDALGLGGVWIGIAPFRDRMERVRQALGLPDDVEPFSLFPLGHPAEKRTQQDRFDKSRVHLV